MRSEEALLPSADLRHFRLQKHGDLADPAYESSLALVRAKRNDRVQILYFSQLKAP
jgi:hypothetical protein